MRNVVLASQAKAKDAGRGIAKWFGLVDYQEMNAMQRDYIHRKVEQRGSAPMIGAAPTHTTRNGFRQRQDAAMVEKALKMAESSSEDEDDGAEIMIQSDAFTRSVDDGVAHYHKIREEERRKDVKPGWLGGEVNRNRNSVRQYRTQGRTRPRQKRHSKVRDQTLVKAQLQAMPTFYPYFIYGITTLQLIIGLLMFAHAQTENRFAKVGLAPEVIDVCNVNTPGACPDGFLGEPVTTNRTIDQNWSLGPTAEYLLEYGSKYSLCMRDDTRLRLDASRVRAEECIVNAPIDSSVGYRCDEATVGSVGQRGYACCRTAASSSAGLRAGMTSFAQCAEFNQTVTTSWTEGDICDQSAGATGDFIVLRPCCSSLDNSCELVTEAQCLFKGGIWHTDKLLCADVSCIVDNCKFTENNIEPLKANPEFRNEPQDPNQWFRFFTSLLVHSGIIQLLLVLTVQYYAGKAVETQAGFLRTMLIYVISGLGGYVTSAIFSPLTVSVGADPAVYGLLGVMMVELFQAWQIVPDAKTQLAKLLTIISVSLLIGTFPYVDNWSHVGGFCFGVVSGVVFLPYITFGKWDARRKKFLLLLCVPLLFTMIVLSFLTFYLIQNTEFCTWYVTAPPACHTRPRLGSRGLY